MVVRAPRLDRRAATARKHKPTYHAQCGLIGGQPCDRQCRQRFVLGRKREQKIYHHHTVYRRPSRNVPPNKFGERFRSALVEEGVQGTLPHGYARPASSSEKKPEVYRARIIRTPRRPPRNSDIGAMNGKNVEG